VGEDCVDELLLVVLVLELVDGDWLVALLLADDDVVVVVVVAVVKEAVAEDVVRLSDVVRVYKLLDVVNNCVVGMLDIELDVDVEDVPVSEGEALEVVVPSPPIPTPSVNDDAGVSLTNEKLVVDVTDGLTYVFGVATVCT
jgi:hypothetical protein